MPDDDPDLRDKVVRLFRERPSGRDGEKLSGGGGSSGGPPVPPGLEARIAKLEDTLGAIHLSLARLETRMDPVATKADVAQISGAVGTLTGKVDAKANTVDLAQLSGNVSTLSAKMDGKAAATELAEIKGRVSRLPSTGTVAGLLAIAAAVIGLLARFHVGS